MLRIVAIDEKFFSDYDLFNVDNELIPNVEGGYNRPYVVILRLVYNGLVQSFAIPFRSNIAGYRDRNEYFALPTRKETRKGNIHGLHFIKMFPVHKQYFRKYKYPESNTNAILTRNYIKKNSSKLVAEAQNYLNMFQNGYRPQYCVDISKLYAAIKKPSR